nr:hypothetical protein Iba_chr12bCG15280 [Ipomoea batatas]
MNPHIGVKLASCSTKISLNSSSSQQPLLSNRKVGWPSAVVCLKLTDPSGSTNVKADIDSIDVVVIDLGYAIYVFQLQNFKGQIKHHLPRHEALYLCNSMAAPSSTPLAVLDNLRRPFPAAAQNS